MKIYRELEKAIEDSYEAGITLAEAEKLAAKCLYAQVQLGKELATSDLDVRMRKSGLKAVKAAVYLDEAKKTDKKPSDVMLAAIVDTNELVSGEQNAFDTAEVKLKELERLYDVFGNAHIFYRGIAKGKFE